MLIGVLQQEGTSYHVFFSYKTLGIKLSRTFGIRGHWGDQDVDGRIILRWIFRKLEWVGGTGWSWLRIGTGGGHLWVR